MPDPIHDKLVERTAAVEERKVAVSERQISLDERRYGSGGASDLVRTNLAGVLAFLTSVASLFIAYQSLRVNDAAQSRQASIETRRVDLETQKVIGEIDEREHRLRFELLEFTAKNRDLIFGEDEVAKDRIAKIMVVAFPAELVYPLFQKLEKVSPSSAAWKEGTEQVKRTALSQQNVTAGGGGMRVIGGFSLKSGMTINLHTKANADVVTYAAVVRSFTGDTVAKWSATELENKGGSFTTQPGNSYNVMVLAVARSASASIHVNFSSPGIFKDEQEINVGDNSNFGWRIFGE